MGVNQLSQNQIIQYFISLAAQNERINTFGFGPIYDIGRDTTMYQRVVAPNSNNVPLGTLVYPLMWVEPVPSTLRRDSLVLKHKIHIIDLVEKDQSNRSDVLSDSLRTCMELKAFMFKDFYYDIFPSDESELTPVFEKYDDETTGYVMDLELQLDWLADVCNIPGMYPSGATFVAGPTFYNVNLGNYLPLTGGVLTGPITGTTANFTTIYSGGTDLSLLFGAGGGGASTFIQNGLNTYTGGTSALPTVNVSALTINTLSVSGTASFTGIITSGGTDLSNIINNSITGITSGLTGSVNINGLNTYTGGTIANQTINISGGTFDNLTISGASGFTYTDSSAAAGKVLMSNANGNATWQSIPSAGNSTFMFTSGASSIATYKQMVTLPNYVASTLVAYPIILSAGPTLMSVFASNVNYPGVTTIPSGTFRFHYDTQKLAGANNYFTYNELYKITTAGTETFLLSSDTSTQTSVNTVVQQDTYGFSTSAITLSLTDRLVVKVYGQMLSSTATVNLRIDDATSARMETPSISVDTTSFIPYTGATSGINLGSQNLKTDGIINANILSATTISASTYYGIPDSFGVSVDGQGAVIVTGVTGYRIMSTNGKITGWNLISTITGNCVFDVWKTTSGSLPTVANSITDSAKPQLTGSLYSASTAISNWTGTTFSSGDVFGFNINSITGITDVNLTLNYLKS